MGDTKGIVVGVLLLCFKPRVEECHTWFGSTTNEHFSLINRLRLFHGFLEKVSCVTKERVSRATQERSRLSNTNVRRLRVLDVGGAIAPRKSFKGSSTSPAAITNSCSPCDYEFRRFENRGSSGVKPALTLPATVLRIPGTVNESLPATARRGKRKTAALAYLHDDTGSGRRVVRKPARRSRRGGAAAKRTPAAKKKTAMQGKGKGNVVPKTKGKGKDKGKKKAAATETPSVSSAKEIIAAPTYDTDGTRQALRACSLEPGRCRQQAGNDQLSTKGGSIGGEWLRIAELNLCTVAIAAGRAKRLPETPPPVPIVQAYTPAGNVEGLTGVIAAVLCAFADDKTQVEAGCVERAAVGTGDATRAGMKRGQRWRRPG